LNLISHFAYLTWPELNYVVGIRFLYTENQMDVGESGRVRTKKWATWLVSTICWYYESNLTRHHFWNLYISVVINHPYCIPASLSLSRPVSWSGIRVGVSFQRLNKWGALQLWE